ncbi:hypothetical protein PIB30_055694 [Stylosanthes scabra]|uniref:Uncharacterized protein n=1 Tax=Stylosanthes scabra TaxID=79078 RepID=A0ABU6TLD3_9FABA|nr:hypothetical protein [Stylosanthes scabra]
MKKQTQKSEDPFSVFDGKNSYGWTICLEQYWNARGTEVHRGGERIERESSEVVSVMEGMQSFCRSGNIYDDWRTSEGSELKVVLVQRPPPEPPNLNSYMVVEAECEPSALELEIREQRRHHHPMAAAGSTEKGRHTMVGSSGCGEGKVMATPGSGPKAQAIRCAMLLKCEE